LLIEKAVYWSIEPVWMFPKVDISLGCADNRTPIYQALSL